MSGSVVRRVTLYSRPGCHLCDGAREALREAGVAFEEVDIAGDPGLEGEYGVLVPVVDVDGRVVFEAGMDPGDLPSVLA